jgi:hypothetical protein
MPASFSIAILSLCVWSGLGMTGEQPPAQRTDAFRRYELDER